MKNQIDGNVKKERVKVLIELGKELQNNYYKSLEGTTEYLLTENYKDGYLYGHLSNYGYARIKSDKNLTNHIFEVKLNKYENECYDAEIVKKI